MPRLTRPADRHSSPLPFLTAASRAYIERTPAARRKELGQFFTPAPLRDRLLDGLALPHGARILDPACGSGEFLLSAARRWPAASLFGIEIDAELAALARAAVPAATIEIADALVQPFAPAFDAVIGNPPYFEFKPAAVLRQRYRSAISGRTNTYALFVKLGLELLRPGGTLAFVVPPSMNNGRFFRALRDEILATARIERLAVLDDPALFAGANQAVMLLRLVKGERDDGRHVFRRGPFTLFAEDPRKLAALYRGATSLDALGFQVRTGSVVWNQQRDLLRERAERGAVRLIWSHAIGDGALEFKDRPGKPGFVRTASALVGPAIVVNRVTGRGKKARLLAAAVPADLRFHGENHVNVVLPRDRAAARRIPAVVRELSSPRALEVVRRLTGNTQISARELAHLIPVGDPA